MRTMKRIAPPIIASLLVSCSQPATVDPAALRPAAQVTPTPSPEPTLALRPIPSSAPTATPAPTPTPSQHGEIRGQVFDPQGVPVDNAQVAARSLNESKPYSQDATTVGGAYRLTQVPLEATIEVTVTKSGYWPRTQTIVPLGNARGPAVNDLNFWERNALTPVATPAPTAAPTVAPTAAPTQTTISYSGTGRVGLKGPFTLQRGVRTFQGSHGGRSNFVVWLQKANGDPEALIFNEIGSFSGQYATMVDATDEYYLDINADGNWSVMIQ